MIFFQFFDQFLVNFTLYTIFKQFLVDFWSIVDQFWANLVTSNNIRDKKGIKKARKRLQMDTKCLENEYKAQICILFRPKMERQFLLL